MSAIQEDGWAAKLFSSALFCLWLSIASVSVWFDAAPAQPAMTARTEVPVTEQGETKAMPSKPAASPKAVSDPAQAASRATPANDRPPDAA